MNRCVSFSVSRVTWEEAGPQLRSVRTAVFVEEQGVPAELEWDELDDDCEHVIAESSTGDAMGTGRLLPDGHIGRMAVLRPWRGRGVGRALMAELLAVARVRGVESVELSAQTHAIGFYERFGFAVVSSEFIEAGIPHCRMRLALHSG